MSPLRYCDDDEFEYNIADREQVRLSFSLGSALYAVRRDLTALYAWSDEPQHIGSQFIGVFGRLHHSLCRARSNRMAASRLRKGLIEQFDASQFKDKPERELRDRLVASLRAEDAAPIWDPFSVIFRYVTESSRRCFAGDWPSRVKCIYEVIGDQPFPGSRFWINAHTVLDLDDPTAPPRVCLRVHPNRLNAETYSAIYAILVHECFCHVAAYRVQQRNDSPFSEGLCDWAAHELFGRWLRLLDPSLEDATRQFGEEIWLLMKTKGHGNKFWHARFFGHVAADHLVRMFMSEGATDQEAVDLVIRLARELIVVEEDLRLKDSFVRDIGLQVGPGVRTQLCRWRDRQASARSVLHVGR
jgi:hypothetical protein